LAVVAASHSPAGAQTADEVVVSVPVFGVGGVSRAGDWAGIKVTLSDQGSRAREVVVWIEQTDADGDFPRNYRELATAPGESKSIWLYTRLPAGMRSGELPVVVHEASTDASGAVQIGRRLGQAGAAVRGAKDELYSIIGVVGNSSAGLLGYTPTRRNKRYAIGGHERVELANGIRPEDLPDRWMGLMSFDALVWTGPQTTALSLDQAAAIREWVIRGGHLVIVMRSGAIDWVTDARFNPLFSIMPAVEIERLEGVNYQRYRGLLTTPDDLRPLPSNLTVHVFTPMPDRRRATDAIRILNGPDGECVVVTRLVGTGAVTLVGLNLTSTALTGFGRPNIESFWNRVLGRRDKALTKDETDDALRRSREVVIYDRQIADRIDYKGDAVKGVMLGFLVFLAYWLIAAPVSFALLKRADLLRHAWIAFVAATVVFTGISWGGVALIKPRRISGRHVTILEHVYGSSIQRSRTFLSLLVPEYGEARISVGHPDGDGGERFHNLLAPWGDTRGAGAFPDSRGYLIDAAEPDRTVFPVRSTIKEFRIDFAGTTGWGMPRPVGGAGTDPGEIRLLDQPPGPGAHVLEGVLEHELQGPLENVVIIVVRGQRYNRNLLDLVDLTPPYAFSLGAAWDPGSPLRLDEITMTERAGSVPRLPNWFRTRMVRSWDQGTSPSDALLAAGLINMMPVPDPDDSRSLAITRSSLHGWDLGRWFTQPCVIVMGVVGDERIGDAAPCPTPIRVNGRPLESRGLTIVRWIYPLPENPPTIGSLPPAGDGQ
ncbi:MAG: hypothetical protein IID31_12665, partial [Planctomycetes bacterium]|nr:hypothetical protein [Planctomycetota bacterium]